MNKRFYALLTFLVFSQSLATLSYAASPAKTQKSKTQKVAPRKVMKVAQVSVPPATTQSAVTATVVKATPTPAPNKKASLVVVLSRNTSLYDKDDGNTAQGLDTVVIAGYSFMPKWSLALRADRSDDLKDSVNSGLTNLQIRLTRSEIDFSWMKLLSRTGVKLPEDKISQKASLKTAISQTFIASLKPEVLFSESLSVDIGLSAARNIHEYEEAVSGAVNNQYSSTQYVEFGWAFNPKWSLTANFTHVNTWSYQNVGKDSFDFNQELSYAPVPAFALAIGHNNSGSSLKADSESSNVQIINDNSSVVYGSLTYIY